MDKYLEIKLRHSEEIKQLLNDEKVNREKLFHRHRIEKRALLHATLQELQSVLVRQTNEVRKFKSRYSALWRQLMSDQ